MKEIYFDKSILRTNISNKGGNTHLKIYATIVKDYIKKDNFGNIVERKSRRGRKFYGCKNYPECDYTTWDQPQKETCPKCGAFMLKHHYKNGRALLYCSNDDCETRINHPINKELEKLRKRAEEKKAQEMAAAKEENK